MKLVDPTSYPDWNDMVRSFPDANIFHSACWAKTLKDSYGYRPTYATWQKQGKIAGAVPLMEIRSFLTGRRGVSLPFSDFCPILAEGSISTREITECLIETGGLRRWKTLELRDSEENVAGYPEDFNFLVHELDLSPGEEAIFSGLRDSTRRNIRKSIKLGVTIVEDNQDSGLKEFYRLNLITRRDHGLPPQPKQFFSSLLKNIISKGNGRILLARHENAWVAAGVFLSFNGKAIYKYGASDKACQKLRANNLLMWEAIKRFSGEGKGSFNFGRTNSGQEGLLQFKRGWGAVEKGLQYRKFRLPDGHPVPSKIPVFGFHNRIFSRLPLSALTLIGRVLYRHIG